MPDYKIQLTQTAQKQLDKLPGKAADVLIKAIAALAHTPRPAGCKKLKGRDGYRIRKGNYRIIYDVHDKIITVIIIAIGNRKDIYD